MKWIKKGLILKPLDNLDWVESHMWVPTVEYRGSDVHRIYYGSRNKNNMSQIGYVEINIENPTEIIGLSNNPVLELGELGTFDDSAVLPSWIIDKGKEKYLYYIGWMQGKRVPYYASLGLAISYDGGESFKRYLKGPLLERNNVDPFMTASACIIIEKNIWKMWYLTNTQWTIINGEPRPRYHIKYAESNNGLVWSREGLISIDFKSDDEYAISRPCVIKENGIYKMWYSYRGQNYRIGYAESENGIDWKRKDENVGIDVSDSGWDSVMIEYPFIFDHKEIRYMVYNGNEFGKYGIGLAVLQK